MFDLVNGLEVDHHIPGQKVIAQNDEVLDEFDEFKKEAKVYFIVAGNYKVESLMFNMGKKQKDIKEDANKEPNKNDISAKGLKKGDFFGEVSILFGCRRTATVKAKQYCECAFLKNEDFLQLIASNGFLKKFLIQNLMRNYHDELRLFLVACLKEIDYLKDTSEEILTHLAINMIVKQGDKDTILADGATGIIIIYDGRLAVTTEIDD